MNGLAWLRTMARRQRKPATGGYVTAPGPIIEPGCTLTAPTRPATLPPGTTIEINLDAMTTPETEQLLREALSVPVRTVATEPRQSVKPSPEHTAQLVAEANARIAEELAQAICPCIGIYSRCHCKAR